MIDRESRDKLALITRRFATGKITNFEFDDIMCDIKSNPYDSGVESIKEYLWTFYDDLREYRATNKDKFSKDTKKHIAKIILFLYSDLEYIYPKVPPFFPILNILTLGIYRYFTNKKFKKSGDINCYPFKNKEDFYSALESIKFMNPS